MTRQELEQGMQFCKQNPKIRQVFDFDDVGVMTEPIGCKTVHDHQGGWINN
jgi:hypothetical protein